MVLRENRMTLPSDMNSAAAKTGLAYSVATATVQYYGNRADINITGQGQNPRLFSGTNPIQHQLSAEGNLNSMMVEELLNPVWYNNRALPQPLPAAFHSTLHTGYQYNMPSQRSPNVFDPALAPMPASTRVAPNPIMTCVNNNVASLMPSNGNPDDTIGFEQLLVDFRVVQPTPRIPPSALGNAVTAASIPTLDHNQIIQTQGQQFLPQTCKSNFGSNAATPNDGVFKMPKSSRVLNLEEAMNRKMRQMIKNRDSAARSRARKLAQNIRLQTDVDELRKENGKLKKMLVKAEVKNGDKKLTRTNSWS